MPGTNRRHPSYDTGTRDSDPHGLIFRRRFGEAPRVTARHDECVPQLASGVSTASSNRFSPRSEPLQYLTAWWIGGSPARIRFE